MNLSPEIIIAVIGSLFSIGVAWGYVRSQIQALERDVWREIGKLRDWRQDLEKDIAEWRSNHLADEAARREHIERRFGDVNATMAQILEQMKASKETLDSINRKMSRIEEEKR